MPATPTLCSVMLQLKFHNSTLSSMSASVERRRAVVLYFQMFKIEYRAVIKFLTKEGKSPAEINVSMLCMGNLPLHIRQ
jgi:hypothetical protein